MKISFLDDEPEIFPMQYGGKARTIIALAKKFASYKNIDNVTVMSRSIKDNRDKFKWKEINFIKLDGYNIIGKIIDECDEADILSVHTSSFTFPYLQTHKAIVINNLHDVIFATSDAGSHLDKAIGGNWDAIISPSLFATNVLKNITTWSNLKERIYTIPRAIDRNTFYKVSPKIAFSKIKKFTGTSRIKQNHYPIIFFPHRVSANKGEIFLPKICELLSKKYPNCLIISTLGKECSLKIPNIINLDWIPTEYIKYFYSISDLTISFSFLPESFSQVCLESIACGAPVLCFRFGNLSDLSKKFPAIKSCKPDIDDIFKGITDILKNKKQTKKDLVTSQDIIKNDYNLDKIAKTYLSTYKSISLNRTVSRKIFGNNTKKREIRYFISPIIADYGEIIYLFNDSKLQKFQIDLLEQKILMLCYEAKTFHDIEISMKIDLKKLSKLIKNLINKKILNQL